MKSSSPSPCVDLLCFFFLFLFSIDSDDQAQAWNHNNPRALQVVPQSCLIVLAFRLPLLDGTTDLGVFSAQFNSVASLSHWRSHSVGDLRPQFLSAGLCGDVLSFRHSLTRTELTRMNLMPRAVRSQYAPNQEVLKAEVKALCQKPGQSMRGFPRELREIARNAYVVEVVCNETLSTTLIAAMSNPLYRFIGRVSAKRSPQMLRLD